MHDYRRTTTRVACAQIPLSIGDTAGNRTTCSAAVESAARDGAQIVVLPELASSGYVFADRGELSSLAERRDGPAISEWADLALAFGLTIVGGFPEAAGDAIYNSAAVVDGSGLRGVYRKAHLWDSENAIFDRGDDLPLVVETDHGRVADQADQQPQRRARRPPHRPLPPQTRYWTDGGAPVIVCTDSGTGMPDRRSGAGSGAP